jgi:hypothetical protein
LWRLGTVPHRRIAVRDAGSPSATPAKQKCVSKQISQKKQTANVQTPRPPPPPFPARSKCFTEERTNGMPNRFGSTLNVSPLPS